MNKGQGVMDVLAAADPVEEHELEGWAISAEGQRLLSRIIDDATALKKRRLVSGFPLRWVAAASAVMMLVGVLAMRANDPPRTGNQQVTVADARHVLLSTALVAAESAPVAGPGQWIYRKLEGQSTGTKDVNGRQLTVLIPTSIEVWISQDDGSVRITGDAKEPKFLTAEDERWWAESGAPAFYDVGTFEKVVPEAGPPENLDTYPTGTEDLLAFLQAKANEVPQCPEAKSGKAAECPPRGDPDTYVFTLASDLLMNRPDAAPKLRSGLFEVMSRVPDTKLDTDAVDPKGRLGTAVSKVVWEDGGRSQRHEVYFDPKSAEVLGFRYVFLEADGTEMNHAYSVLLESGVVEEAGLRP